MTTPPILAALRKHKAGVILIGLQTAVTLAIVCNIFFIVGQRLQRIERPTGLAEGNLFLISQRYIDAPSGNNPASLDKLDSMQLNDLEILRGLPDVRQASPVTTMPLLRDIFVEGVSLKPAQSNAIGKVNVFTGDEEMLHTLGLRLIAGRDFTRTDVEHVAPNSNTPAPLAIVTKALSDKLFPDRGAVGQPIYLNGSATPTTIIGVIARMLTANADGGDDYAWDSVLIPRRIDAASTMYAVRTRPGRLKEAMQAARKALFKADPLRIIPTDNRYEIAGVHSFAEIRNIGYALDMASVRVLCGISLILLMTTGVGMAGLTSFWVNQRRKQIGIRRALGARKVDILRYFQIENFMISGSGCVLGAMLAIGLNLALMRVFEMSRLPFGYVIAGIASVLILGQLAVFIPAHRASKVPPIVSTRSV